MDHRLLSSYEDVITEILSYLPVKSLFKLKTVCKSWNNIISSSSFARLHLLNHHIKNNTSTFKSCPKLSPDTDLLNKILAEETCPRKIKIAGPVEDWICIYGAHWSQRIAVFDLRNMKTELLPLYPKWKGYFSGTHVRSLGFGRKKNEHIVVQLLSHVVGSKPNVGDIRADVYSQNTWVEADCDFRGIVIKKAIASTSKDGSFCYWLAEKQSCGVLFLMSFDFRRFYLNRTALPRCFNLNRNRKKIEIFTKNDNSLVLFSYSELVLERWVLSSIRKGREWTKLASIGPLLQVMKPVAFWEHHGVVFKYGPDGKYLVFYDDATQELRITDIPGHHHVKVFEYKGGLISLGLTRRYQNVLGKHARS